MYMGWVCSKGEICGKPLFFWFFAWTSELSGNFVRRYSCSVNLLQMGWCFTVTSDPAFSLARLFPSGHQHTSSPILGMGGTTGVFTHFGVHGCVGFPQLFIFRTRLLQPLLLPERVVWKRQVGRPSTVAGPIVGAGAALLRLSFPFPLPRLPFENSK